MDIRQYEDREQILSEYHAAVRNEIERVKNSHEWYNDETAGGQSDPPCITGRYYQWRCIHQCRYADGADGRSGADRKRGRRDRRTWCVCKSFWTAGWENGGYLLLQRWRCCNMWAADGHCTWRYPCTAFRWTCSIELSAAHEWYCNLYETGGRSAERQPCDAVGYTKDNTKLPYFWKICCPYRWWM